MNDEKHSALIFNEGHGLKFYRACILIDRRCDEFVQAADLPDDVKTDLHYYVTMLAMCELCKKAQPTAENITDALVNIPSGLNDTLLKWCLDTSVNYYGQHGATDTTAKGRDMENSIKSELAGRYELRLI